MRIRKRIRHLTEGEGRDKYFTFSVLGCLMAPTTKATLRLLCYQFSCYSVWFYCSSLARLSTDLG